MKRLGKLFAILLTVLVMTGCVKEDIHMNIKENGDVDLSIIVACEESVSSMMDLDSTKEKFSSQGYKVEEYVEEDMKGFKATKGYKMENISSTTAGTVSLVDFIENPSEKPILFQKTGDKSYKASFEIDTRSDEEDSEMAEMYAANIKISYSVTLPSKAKSHNATKVEGNTLTWDAQYGELTSINYEFSLSGTSPILWIIIAIVGVAVVAIIIVVVVMNGKNKKNSSGMMLSNQQPVTSMNDMQAVPETSVETAPMASVSPEIPQTEIVTTSENDSNVETSTEEQNINNQQ